MKQVTTDVLVIWFYLVTMTYKKVVHSPVRETARGVGVLPHVYARSSALRLHQTTLSPTCMTRISMSFVAYFEYLAY